MLQVSILVYAESAKTNPSVEKKTESPSQIDSLCVNETLGFG